MTTIDAGENIILNFTVRDEDGEPVPTAEIASFTVKLVYQVCNCGDPEVVLGTWTFTAPDVFSAGMTSTGDGVFKIEVLASQTLEPGLISAIFTTAFIDPEFFSSGQQVDVTRVEDVFEIVLFGAEEVPVEADGNVIVDDNGDGIMDDNGDLLVDEGAGAGADNEFNVADDNGDNLADDNGDLLVA